MRDNAARETSIHIIHDVRHKDRPSPPTGEPCELSDRLPGRRPERCRIQASEGGGTTGLKDWRTADVPQCDRTLSVVPPKIISRRGLCS